MKLLERLATDAYKDKYFNQLFDDINKLFFKELFLEKVEQLGEKRLTDIMIFCDILSNSSDVKHRNIAYKIITLLFPFYQENSSFQTISAAVLSRIGNFPALQLLDYDTTLPIDREFEKEVKQIIQKVENFEDIYLTDSQFSLYQKMKNSDVFSFSGPTSMGKSFIMKINISEQMKKEKKPNITVIVPTRALIHQFAMEIKKDLKRQIDEHRYIVLTNGSLDGINIEDSHFIMILTPERLLSYLSEELYPKIHCLFVDEAHKLASEHDKRSVTLYTAIERAIYSNRNIRLFFASPNVSNPEVFLKLFNKEVEYVYYSNESPVAQQLFFVDLIDNTVVHYTDNGSKVYEPAILNKVHDNLDLIHALSKEQSNLIYCHSRRDTVAKAREFSERYKTQHLSTIQKKKISEAIQIIKTVVHPDYYLIDCLKTGVAYHFGSLPQVVRNNIEQLFKNGVIKYLFCTSTLLEGVNLPAKNVFILKNKNGIRNFNKVDFWNLAGRAGRLKYELSGNIFCIRDDVKYWKKVEDLIENKEKIQLKPTVSINLEKNMAQIETAIQNKEIKKLKKSEQDIVHYLANIISIDTLDLSTGYKSPIIEKLLQNQQATVIEIAKEKVSSLETPKRILKTNQFMAVEQQESAFQFILKNRNKRLETVFPSQINYKSCLEVLNLFHSIYQWDKYESRLKHKSSLKYFALLMNNWINGVSLNELINQSIIYYEKNKKKIKYYEGNEEKYEVFRKKNRIQVNTLINELIKEIEDILRFSIQKYVNHYYLLLQEVYGENRAGNNWANFLEYGTRSTIVITLQNMGLSRYVANLLMEKYSSFFDVKNGNLIKIYKNRLLDSLEEGSIEEQEVQLFL